MTRRSASRFAVTPDEMKMLYVALLLVSTAVAHESRTNTSPEDVNTRLAEVLETSNRNSFNSPSTTTNSISCTSPNNEPGICGPLSQCPLYIPLIHQLGDPATISFFRARICRILPRALHICCPITPDETERFVLPTINECGLPSGDRIVGGIESEVGSWPWLAAIGTPLANNGFQSICGGTLITQRHVLSAAHCFVEGIPDSTHVRLGEHHLTSNSDGAFPLDIKIASRRTKGYNPFTKENDIELLFLEQDVTYNDFIKPACLPVNPSERNNHFEGDNATVVGWGRFTFDEKVPTSQVPMQADVPIVPLQPCSDVYQTRTAATIVDTRNICAGQGLKDACSGDSGGPLNYLNNADDRYYVVGIVSHGVECASSTFPGVYTRVGAFMDWILNNLQ